MNATLSLVVSVLALAVSGVTVWLTMFRRGSLHMTQPTVVFLGPDGGRARGDAPRIKVFLRTLMFSSSERGQTVESMYVNLQRGETRQNFSVWVYGDEKLTRGSGIFVGREGLATNHHFLLPEDGARFPLVSGKYTLRIFAKRVTDSAPKKLSTVTLHVSEAHASKLAELEAGIYFDWGPDQQSYHAHVEVKPTSPVPRCLLEVAAQSTRSVEHD